MKVKGRLFVFCVCFLRNCQLIELKFYDKFFHSLKSNCNFQRGRGAKQICPCASPRDQRTKRSRRSFPRCYWSNLQSHNIRIVKNIKLITSQGISILYLYCWIVQSGDVHGAIIEPFLDYCATQRSPKRS